MAVFSNPNSQPNIILKLKRHCVKFQKRFFLFPELFRHLEKRIFHFLVGVYVAVPVF